MATTTTSPDNSPGPEKELVEYFSKRVAIASWPTGLLQSVCTRVAVDHGFTLETLLLPPKGKGGMVKWLQDQLTQGPEPLLRMGQ